MCDIQIPIWGHMVMKMECANHVIKCNRNRLENILQDFKNIRGNCHSKQSRDWQLLLGVPLKCMRDQIMLNHYAEMGPVTFSITTPNVALP